MFFHIILAVGLLTICGADRPEIKQDTDEVVAGPLSNNSSNNSIATVLLDNTMVDKDRWVKWTSCSADFVPTPDQPYLRNAFGHDASYHLLSVIKGKFDTAAEAKTHDEGENRDTEVHKVDSKQCRSKYLNIVEQSLNAEEQTKRVPAQFNDKYIVNHAKYMIPPGRDTKFLEINNGLLAEDANPRIYDQRKFLYGFVLHAVGVYYHLYNVYGETTTDQPSNTFADQLEAAKGKVENLRALQETERYNWMKISNQIDGKSPKLYGISAVEGETSNTAHGVADVKSLIGRWSTCNGYFKFLQETTFRHSLSDGEQTKPPTFETDIEHNFYHLELSETPLNAETITKKLTFAGAKSPSTIICRHQTLIVVSTEPPASFSTLDSTDFAIHTEYEIPDTGADYFIAATQKLMRSSKLFKQITLLRSETSAYNDNTYFHLYMVFDSVKKYDTHNESPEFLVWKGARSYAQHVDGNNWVKLTDGVARTSPTLNFKMLMR